MKSFVCKKCGHTTKTATGIKMHIRKKHGTKKIRKGVDFEPSEETVDEITAKVLSRLSNTALVSIVEGAGGLDPIQQAALDKLSKR